MQNQIVAIEANNYSANTWQNQQQQPPKTRPLRKRKPYAKKLFSAKAISQLKQVN